jgi:DNA-binding transcriptional LysR family regulator
MTLKQLEAFYLAATLGSFALAAQRAHVTQSSLSKRIAELEGWVGAELFDRSGQRAQLTEAGHRLLPVAAQMLELKEAARGALNSSPTLAGTCRFGISELGALTWLPRFVARVRTEHSTDVTAPCRPRAPA